VTSFDVISTNVHQTCHQCRFPGNVVTFGFCWRSKIFPSPIYRQNHFLENLQLKPMKSVSAYFLTTDKAIGTKLDQTIKKLNFKGRDQGHVTYF